MKLMTNIPARRDGTVIVHGLDGQTYVFRADATGELACDIGHKETVARLLLDGLFYPDDPADYDLAIEMTQGDDGDGDGDDAAPIEAKTPPSAPKRGRKKAAE